jgi:hypothetical protein
VSVNHPLMISVIHLKGSFKYDLSTKEKKVEHITLGRNSISGTRFVENELTLKWKC